MYAYASIQNPMKLSPTSNISFLHYDSNKNYLQNFNSKFTPFFVQCSIPKEDPQKENLN